MASYDVAFGHTAKVQYKQIHSEALISTASPASFQEAPAKLHRTRMLIAQITDPARVGGDRLVIDIDNRFPFEMHYRSEATTYIYYRRLEPKNLVVITYLCELEAQSASSMLLHLIAAGKADLLASLGIAAIPLPRYHMQHLQ